MSEAIDYRNDDVPDGFRFSRTAVYELPLSWLGSEKVQIFVQRVIDGADVPFDVYPTKPVLLLVDPLADRKVIHSQVDARLDSAVHAEWFADIAKLWGDLKRASNVDKNLVEYFICYYYRVYRDMMPSEVEQELRRILGTVNQLQSQQIAAKVDAFNKLSVASPWVFLLPRKQKAPPVSR